MQVASILPLSSITVPSNAMSFYKILAAFIAFDFLPDTDLDFKNQLPYRESFKLAGFSTINVISNLGTILCLVLSMLIALSFVSIAVYLIRGKVKKASNFMDRYFMPSTALQAWTRMLFVMYIALIFSCIIAFKMWGIQ